VAVGVEGFERVNLRERERERERWWLGQRGERESEVVVAGTGRVGC
jgi:hypothetical protein